MENAFANFHWKSNWAACCAHAHIFEFLKANLCTCNYNYYPNHKNQLQVLDHTLHQLIHLVSVWRHRCEYIQDMPWQKYHSWNWHLNWVHQQTLIVWHHRNTSRSMQHHHKSSYHNDEQIYSGSAGKKNTIMCIIIRIFPWRKKTYIDCRAWKTTLFTKGSRVAMVNVSVRSSEVLNAGRARSCSLCYGHGRFGCPNAHAYTKFRLSNVVSNAEQC